MKLKSLVIMLVVGVMFVTMSCGQGGSEYVGTWKSVKEHPYASSGNQTIVITQTSDKWFSVTVFGQHAGEYKYEDGALVGTNQKLPLVAINKSNDTITVFGDWEFTKVK